jgi:hypothetical protein
MGHAPAVRMFSKLVWRVKHRVIARYPSQPFCTEPFGSAAWYIPLNVVPTMITLQRDS